MPQCQTKVIPHCQVSREQFRQPLSLPATAQVMLAFAHIRDNKNLDLVL